MAGAYLQRIRVERPTRDGGNLLVDGGVDALDLLVGREVSVDLRHLPAQRVARLRVIRKTLIAPIPSAAAIVTSSASTTFMPPPSSSAKIIPTVVTTPAADRSIPPPTITKVAPTAMSSMVLFDDTMLVKLRQEIGRASCRERVY
jgi:hypothetical protein